MTTRADITNTAAEYVGTPWVHQGRLKGLGVDCCGFIASVAEESGAIPAAGFEQDYRRAENGERMIALLTEYMDYVSDKVEDAQPGDVIALCDEQLKQPDVPRHLVFLSAWVRDGVPYIIHAGSRGVVRHRMDALWKRRVHSVWKIRSIEDE